MKQREGIAAGREHLKKGLGRDNHDSETQVNNENASNEIEKKASEKPSWT